MGRLAAPADTVIDLGEIVMQSPSGRPREPGHGPGNEPDDGPGNGPDDGAPGIRRGLVLLFAALLAAVIVGDTPRVPLRDVIVLPAEHSEFNVTSDVLYVLRGPYIPNQVIAYGLRDGRPMWQRESPANTAYSQVYQVGDRTLLVPNPCLTPLPVTTVAVDTRTGREVWRRPGVPERVVAGSRLVVMSRSGPTSTCATGYPSGNPFAGYWDGVDARTGAVIWSAETPPRARISFDSDEGSASRRGVSVVRDGTVTSTDLRTGVVTGRISRPELALPAQPAIGAAAATLTVIGGQVLMLERAKTTETAAVVVDITAYDAATLTRRWSARADAGPGATRPGANAVVLSDCGSMLCLGGPHRTVFLDPDTGGERWHTGLSLLAVQNARALLADPDATSGEVPLGGLTVRDVRTGQPRGDLPGWRILNDRRSSEGAPVLGRTIGDRTWLALLNLGQGSAATMGSAPGTYSSCVDTYGYLVCRRIDGSVQVWRTPVA